LIRDLPGNPLPRRKRQAFRGLKSRDLLFVCKGQYQFRENGIGTCDGGDQERPARSAAPRVHNWSALTVSRGLKAAKREDCAVL
jgi:hypothetical protein